MSADLCAAFRSFLLQLAETNMKRWKKFTGDFPMTRDKFGQRVVDSKFTENPVEISVLWDAFNVEMNELQFREFVAFLQNEIPEQEVPRINTSDPMVLMNNVALQRRNVIDAFLQVDPGATGFVSQKEFTDVLISLRVASNPREVMPLIMTIDVNNTGHVSYYKLMYDSSFVKPESQRSTRKILDHSALTKSRGESRIPQPTHAGRHLDPTIFGDKTIETQEAPRPGRCLDPSIFGEKHQEHAEQPARGGRNLDPSIFGEKVHTEVVQNEPINYDFSKTKDGTEYSEEVVISLIARTANTKFRSIRDCFGSWRNGERLEARDILLGMAQESNIELPLPTIDRLVSQYGGPLTVASFTRLVSDGARINAPEPVAAAPPPRTEVDDIIEKLAAGVKGKVWENVIMPSKNALDLARNLKKLGVNVKSDEVRGLLAEMGMQGICNAIKEKNKPPKQRRTQI
ncbi:hypothetical protein TVAG_208840 [Trichomonas vaginalis G3]|uniref:EF hand family protein n=1 Tax=Trichomonas vaginalis (strain ATCC PRA-98 / G3) TaxID=412133 RepID=A2DVC6_TRIV3|nr:EF-hand family [Trichomonas vaginalis G3]EAY15605.1 hypothetical protein TVAG_208840 [Trichomonas vaginalis G3]KAI5530212.1 EF-hand family [Trichomonas vaginalis G3]|eukprot:XP_001327828.1 hypothetical protein [Trichomonas vaginalis G3]